ncbi:MAG: exodeoxyribonuclease VII small subunit [Phycisphaerales bacterium]|nr:exodeoxyribonuclease VII small subunit [Phycisphaerales bacterium]
MSKKLPTFDEALEQVETLIEQIEHGEIGLEEALDAYEKGAGLIKHCRTILDKAEQRVSELQVDLVNNEVSERRQEGQSEPD